MKVAIPLTDGRQTTRFGRREQFALVGPWQSSPKKKKGRRVEPDAVALRIYIVENGESRAALIHRPVDDRREFVLYPPLGDPDSMLHREFLGLVAIVLAGLHGVIALLGLAGLHRVSGCEHRGIGACCHEAIPHEECCHAASGTGDRVSHVAAPAGRVLDDAEHCRICQWFSGAQVPDLGGGSTWTAVLVASAVVYDSRLSLPRIGLEQAFPRGPPSLALI